MPPPTGTRKSFSTDSELVVDGTESKISPESGEPVMEILMQR
jgi:hypothetical protein